MKKNNLLDFLIILLVYIAVACIPFDLFIVNAPIIVTILRFICQILVSVFIFIYVNKKTELSLETDKKDWKTCLLFIPTLLVCFSNFFYYFFIPGDFIGSVPLTIVFDILLMLSIAFNEDLIFRLILINNIENKAMWKKVLIGSLVFALCHLTSFLSSFNPFDLLSLVYTLPLGILLGFSFTLTNSVIPGIVIHFLFNVFNQLVFTNLVPNVSNVGLWILSNVIVAVAIGAYLLLILIVKNKDKKII